MDKRTFSRREGQFVNETVNMLEDALEIMGNQMMDDVLTAILHMNEQETVEFLKSIHKNIYTMIKVYPPQLEQEFEDFKAMPETQAKVQQMMEELTAGYDQPQITQGEGNDDEGSGNLQ